MPIKGQKIGHYKNSKLNGLKEQIESDYLSKVPIDVILEKYNISKGAFHRAIKRWGTDKSLRDMELKRKVFKDVGMGKGAAEIARKYDVPYTTVRRMIKKGFKHSTPYMEKHKEQIMEMFRQGKNSDEVSKAFNISISTLKRALHLWGITVYELHKTYCNKRNEELLKYLKTHTTKEASKEFNLSTKTIRGIAFDNGFRLDNPKRGEGYLRLLRNKCYIVKMLMAGATQDEVRKKYNVGRYTIMTFLKDCGIKSRTLRTKTNYKKVLKALEGDVDTSLDKVADKLNYCCRSYLNQVIRENEIEFDGYIEMQRANIEHDVKKGIPLKEVAEEYQISFDALVINLKQWGIIKNKDYNKYVKIRIVNLLRYGSHTVQEVADMLGMTRKQVTYHARSIGYSIKEAKHIKVSDDMKEKIKFDFRKQNEVFWKLKRAKRAQHKKEVDFENWGKY